MNNSHNSLTICIVGYNEEKNIPKLLKSLGLLSQYQNLSTRVIYCDQKSTDDSIRLLKHSPNIIIQDHPQYGICEISRKRIYDELLDVGQWILFMDADETISKKLIEEIQNIINENEYDICLVPIDMYFMDTRLSTNYQPRLFKKGSIRITEHPHTSLNIFNSNKIYKFKNKLNNSDLKQYGQEIKIMIEKLNRYTNKEVDQIDYITRYRLSYQLFIKPIVRFFGFGMWRGYFFKGLPGWIMTFHNTAYEFFKGAKLYEKIYLTYNKEGKKRSL